MVFTGDPVFETARIRSINDLESVFLNDAILTIKNPTRFLTLKKEGVPTSDYLLQADANQNRVHIPHLATDQLDLAVSTTLSSDQDGNVFHFNADPDLTNVFFNDIAGNFILRLSTISGGSTFYKQAQFRGGLLLSKAPIIRIEDNEPVFTIRDKETEASLITVNTATQTTTIKDHLEVADLATGTVQLAVDSATDTVRVHDTLDVGGTVITPQLDVSGTVSTQQLDVGGTVITQHRHASATLSTSINHGDVAQVAVTVSGAAVGDTVAVGLTGTPEKLIVSGQVTTADTVMVTLYNLNGATVDLTGRTLNVDTWRH